MSLNFLIELFSQNYNLKHASKEFSAKILKEYNDSRPLGPQDKMCYAPFKSIYFGHYGKAHVCCYNRDYVIGTYPKQSIREIWMSQEAENLRTWISHNNLDYGCQHCKHHILAKNFDANKAKQYDDVEQNSNGFPSVIEFELSNTCNLECTMCSGTFSSKIRQNREGLPPLPQVYDSSFVEQLTEFIPYLEEVKFYGGEPFLIEVYYEIWEKIIELNSSIRISVQTNATILNKRVKKIMEQSNFHINVSIDSLIPERYEKIRVHAKFDRVMENIKWFKNYCVQRGTFFGISACFMQENWDEAPEFVRYCQDLDCQLYFHFLAWPDHKAIAQLENEKISEIYKQLSEQHFEKGNQRHQKNVKHFKDTLKQIQFLIEVKPSGPETYTELQEIRMGLKRHVKNSPELNEQTQQETLAMLNSKIDSLVSIFGTKLVQKGLQHLDFSNPMEINKFIRIFEKTSLKDLISFSSTKKQINK